MIETSTTVAKLFEAFHLAQGEMDGVHKDSKNDHFRSRYASLENVIGTARPVLNKYGLAWTQAPGPVVDGRLTVTTQIMHTSGEWMRSTFHMPVSKPDPQGVGSATTYALRYALMAILGLPPTDDDAEAAMPRQAAKEEPKSPPKRKADSRQDYAAMVQEIRDCANPAQLKAWWEKNQSRIKALPIDWQPEILVEKDAQKARLMDERQNLMAAG